MRILLVAALSCALTISLAGAAGANSISTLMTVSITVVNECSASTTANTDGIVTESCSDGTTATGLHQIAEDVNSTAMVQPQITVDGTGTKTITF